MAIEIAIKISGKNKNSANGKQAIFIQDYDLMGVLSEVRTIIAKQDIEVPKEYRFMSPSKNLISWAVEDTLLLSNILIEVSTGTESDTVKKYEAHDQENASQSDNFKKGSASAVPELWLTSTSEAEENMDANDGSQSQPESDGEKAGHSGQDGAQHPEQDHANVPKDMAPNCQLCPWTAFLNIVHGRADSKSLFKLVFILLVIMFALLASLTLTFHMLFWTFSSLTTTPEFTSMVAKFKSAGGSSAEEVTNLRLKLMEQEVTWKHQFEHLNSKLGELEDIYLNDLALHKRELATLKSRQVELSANFASRSELEALTQRMDLLMEYAKLPKESNSGRHQDKKKGKKGKEGGGMVKEEL